MGRILSKKEWLRRKRIKNISMLFVATILLIVIAIYTVLFITKMMQGSVEEENNIEAIKETLTNQAVISEQYLTPNPYSRPETKLETVKGVVIHYTANPGTSAKSNRSYFEGLANKKTTSASSHYIIGLKGEIIQCIPLTEIAYASNERNVDTISIECCHPDETGEFNEQTYNSLISLVAELCVEFDLKEEDVIRHYDVNKKPCPVYYVDNEDAWIQLKADVVEQVKQIKMN